MVLLPVLAGHAELAAVDGDVHLRHAILMVTARSRSCASSTERMVSIAASSRRAISRLVGLERARARRLRCRVGGEPRAVGAERLDLLGRARPRRGRPRAGARPPLRARRAPAPGAWWPPRSRSDRSSLALLHAAADRAGREKYLRRQAIRAETLRAARRWRQRLPDALSQCFRRPVHGATAPTRRIDSRACVLSHGHPDRPR